MININQKSYLFIFVVLFIAIGASILSSCQDDSRFIPDISEIQADLKVKRFDRDFAQIDTVNSNTALSQLAADYPSFFEVYFMQIMADRPIKKDNIISFAEEIVKEGYIEDLQDTIEVYFNDFSPQINDIEKALRYYRYYFEDDRPKTLVTFISEYGIGACTIGQDTLGIGLDLYLGEGYSEYDPSIFPQFIQQSMTKAHIPVHLMKTLVRSYLSPPTNNRMLDIMIYNGKVLYLTSLLLPEYDYHMIMEYTPEDMDWVKNNELQIWSHFMSEDLLYSSSKKDIQKLIGPSPNAPGMPPEAPGETANWIGMQIIKAYMKRYPDTSIDTLLSMSDAQEILERSRYRP